MTASGDRGDRDGRAPFPPGLSEAVADRGVVAWLDAAGLHTVHLGLFDASGVLRQKRLNAPAAARAMESGWSFVDAVQWWGLDDTVRRTGGSISHPAGSSSARVVLTPSVFIRPCSWPSSRRRCATCRRASNSGGSSNAPVRQDSRRGWDGNSSASSSKVADRVRRPSRSRSGPAGPPAPLWPRTAAGPP